MRVKERKSNHAKLNRCRLTSQTTTVYCLHRSTLHRVYSKAAVSSMGETRGIFSFL